MANDEQPCFLAIGGTLPTNQVPRLLLALWPANLVPDSPLWRCSRVDVLAASTAGKPLELWSAKTSLASVNSLESWLRDHHLSYLIHLSQTPARVRWWTPLLPVPLEATTVRGGMVIDESLVHAWKEKGGTIESLSAALLAWDNVPALCILPVPALFPRTADVRATSVRS